MMRLFLPLLTAAFLSGCATNTIHPVKPPDSAQLRTSRAQLVGTWFGDQPTKEGGRRLELTHHHADGTYVTLFRVMEHGRVTLEQTETGLWGYANSVYFTITRATGQGKHPTPVNPTHSFYYDTYAVISLDGNAFVYQNPADGNIYRERKVADNFQMPAERVTLVGVE